MAKGSRDVAVASQGDRWPAQQSGLAAKVGGRAKPSLLSPEDGFRERAVPLETVGRGAAVNHCRVPLDSSPCDTTWGTSHWRRRGVTVEMVEARGARRPLDCQRSGPVATGRCADEGKLGGDRAGDRLGCRERGRDRSRCGSGQGTAAGLTREVAAGHRGEDPVLADFEVLLGHADVGVAEGGLQDHEVVATIIVYVTCVRLSQGVGAEPPVIEDSGADEGGFEDAVGVLTAEGAGRAIGSVFAAQKEREAGSQFVAAAQP